MLEMVAPHRKSNGSRWRQTYTVRKPLFILYQHTSILLFNVKAAANILLDINDIKVEVTKFI